MTAPPLPPAPGPALAANPEQTAVWKQLHGLGHYLSALAFVLWGMMVERALQDAYWHLGENPLFYPVGALLILAAGFSLVIRGRQDEFIAATNARAAMNGLKALGVVAILAAIAVPSLLSGLLPVPAWLDRLCEVHADGIGFGLAALMTAVVLTVAGSRLWLVTRGLTGPASPRKAALPLFGAGAMAAAIASGWWAWTELPTPQALLWIGLALTVAGIVAVAERVVPPSGDPLVEQIDGRAAMLATRLAVAIGSIEAVSFLGNTSASYEALEAWIEPLFRSDLQAIGIAWLAGSVLTLLVWALTRLLLLAEAGHFSREDGDDA